MSVMKTAVESNSQTYLASTKANGTSSKSTDYGKTIGNPTLSEEGQKYYNELKKKYGNLDFILVSSDMKEQAESQASRYASPNKTVVLIDEEKIEKMATDKDYRKKYEGIIDSAITQLAQIKVSLKSSGANVKGYGIKIDDGGIMSLFAVLKKSTAAQKKRIEEKAEAKKTAQKAADKKAQKKEQEERLKKTGTKDTIDTSEDVDEDTVTVSATSVEELLQKISDYTFAEKSNYVKTKEEQMVGQHIDFQG